MSDMIHINKIATPWGFVHLVNTSLNVPADMLFLSI